LGKLSSVPQGIPISDGLTSADQHVYYEMTSKNKLDMDAFMSIAELSTGKMTRGRKNANHYTVIAVPLTSR